MTGKSTLSKIIALYNICKLDHMDDPWRSLGISRTKDIAFTFIHTNAETANKEFIQSIKDIMTQSPYFCNPIHSFKNFRFQAEGTRNTKSLGTDTIFYVLSEVNFWKPAWVSKEKMDTVLGSYTSRFNKWQHYIGGIIFDTSAKGDAAVMEKFVKENALGDKLLTIRASQWEVKGNERGGYFQNGGFWVYAGDSMKSPFILKDDETPDLLCETMSYDKDRFIWTPNELYAEFKSDIIKALNDKAGYSTHSTGKFFEDPSMVTQCISMPKLNEDSISVNFYDTEDKLIYKLQDAVAKIDPNMPCYIHIDMGYVSDLCGFSLIQFKNWVFFDNDRKTKMPSFTAPICVGISRLAGQETSVLHIYDLIMELSKKYEIASVSYDSHQTRPIAQELTRAGIDNRYISVDRTTEPYIVLKNLMGRKLIDIPNNEILMEELVNLKYEGPDKIDHPCLTGDTRVKVLCRSDYMITNVAIKDIVGHHREYETFTWDEIRRDFVICKISDAFITKSVNKVHFIRFTDGYLVKCTDDHRFLTISGYIEAKDLKVGTEVIGYKGNKIVSMTGDLYLKDYINVYDLTIDSPYHNFCLSNGAVVHNCDGSKDISDSLCGAIYNAYTNIDMASEPSQKTFNVKSQVKLLDMASNNLNPNEEFFRSRLTGMFK